MSLRDLVQRGARRVGCNLRRAGGAPFRDKSERRLIVHCAHHRVGSTWFGNVLQAIADEYGLRFQKCTQAELRPDTDLFVQDHSLIDIGKLPPRWGFHTIRDPRDVIVSRYFYHLWTKEKWAHIPRPEYGGVSYQVYLNSLDYEQGILIEIDKFVEYGLAHMLDWNYHHPDFLELRYEDIIRDEEGMFRRLFAHYHFDDAATERSIAIVKRFSFENQTKRKVGEVQAKSHLRSGRPGEWRDVLSEKHKARCKELFGDALIKLGYETGGAW